MKRVVLLFAVMASVLLVGGVAAAEPMKNQIRVPVTCDNGEDYTVVINGMGKAGHVVGSTSNIVIKSYTATYSDPATGELIGGDEYGQGNKKGLEDDLINCTGQITTDLVGLGSVTAVFEFEGFITPRGK
jgi:hypothetical protein